jgi:hypothetical protein
MLTNLKNCLIGKSSENGFKALAVIFRLHILGRIDRPQTLCEKSFSSQFHGGHNLTTKPNVDKFKELLNSDSYSMYCKIAKFCNIV